MFKTVEDIITYYGGNQHAGDKIRGSSEGSKEKRSAQTCNILSAATAPRK